MRPDRKERLQAPVEHERLRQEMDELLATSQRLLAEMQILTERAKQLAEQHVEVVKAIERRK